ncbi:hypothetical protein CRE_28186 [Caenorhabditis remanei]|uniref:F-box domain-containing protein n=1 Tax=Caenorhabditis remanei TaxID=31234 RepID=E3LMS3_CAERE|nr:hypothetical protein CRE_28186 [Caenorhabditis remanei]
MSKSFPLLRLPHLALLHVLRFFSTADLVDISLCSKVTQYLVKRVIKKPRKLQFFIDGEFQIWITLRRSQIIWTFYYNELKENPYRIPSSGIVKVTKWSGWGVKTMEKNYQMNDFGIRNWMDHIAKLFNLLLDDLTIRDFVKMFEIQDVRSLVDGLKIQNVRIGYFIPDPYVQTILESVQISKKLVLPSTSKQISPENIKFNMEELKLELSNFLTIDHVSNMNCRFIDLGYSNFEDSQLNLFLKSWMTGEWNRELEVLKTRSEEGKIWITERILDGLDALKVTAERAFRIKSVNSRIGKEVKLTAPSWDIHRENTIGSVTIRSIDDIQSCFLFCVWPG